MRKTIYFIIFQLLILGVSFAQISNEGSPAKLSAEDISVIPVIHLNCIEEDSPKLKKDNDPRLKTNSNAIICEVNKKITEAGILTIQEDGTKIWRLGLYSGKAESLSIVFSRYKLSKGVKVFVFDKEQKQVLGAFTYKNNKPYNLLAISPVFSDLIYIEMQALDFVSDPGEIEIGYVARQNNNKKNSENVKDGFYGTSGSCNVDINCINSSDIQQQKHSVVRIFYHGDERCTGTLINNTRENGQPYLLTANHCISSQAEANRTIFFFDYESPTCEGADGSTELSVSGSTLIAGSDLDFSLLKLSENPPFYYHPYFSGWDRRNIPPSNSYTIHHPWGDVKKISFEDHEAVTGSYSAAYAANTFWQVLHWEIGTTERGSSGAGLFNENNRLVGSLTGGDAFCENSVNDFFQKFYSSWDYYPEPSKQLKYWIDPLFTGAEFMDGYDPYKSFWDTGDTLTNIPASEELGIINFGFGYASGHNPDQVSLFAEHFFSEGQKSIIAAYLNVAISEAGSEESIIKLHVFEGGDIPGRVIFTKEVNLFEFIAGENLIPFDTIIAVTDDFYVGYEVFYTNNDFFAVNMTVEEQETNSAYVFYNNDWTGMDNYIPVGFPASLDIKPVVFDSVPVTKPEKKLFTGEIELRPNPARTYVNIRLWEMPENDVEIELYNISGQLVYKDLLKRPDINILLNLENFYPGMYVINVKINNFNIKRKLLIFSE